jgi:hypothetical protein
LQGFLTSPPNPLSDAERGKIERNLSLTPDETGQASPTRRGDKRLF